MGNKRKKGMWHILWRNYFKEMGYNIEIGGCMCG
jgi:hypothetical protein